ncbi:MAG: glycosyltransferase family 39 protein [Anaerolineae bacterium]
MARIGERGALLTLLVAAFALRVGLLQDQSLWPDEGISWYLAANPRALPQADHPPLYFLVLGAWMRLAGDSVLALRFPSVVPDVLLAALLWRWGRRWGRPGAGILAALLWMASPLAVWYATEARGYAWLAFLGVCSSYLVLAATRPGLYFLVGAAALLIHPFAALLLGGHGWLLGGRWREGRLEPRWVAAWLALPLALVPWLLQVLPQAGRPTYWPGAFQPGEALLRTLATWAAGPSWAAQPVAQRAGGGLLGMAMLGALAWATRRVKPPEGARPAWTLWGLLAFPFLGAGALAFLWPKYAPRYLMFLFPLLTWLAAEGLAWALRSRRAVALGALALAGAWVAFDGWALARTAREPALERPDFAHILAYIQREAQPGDALILVGGHTESVVRYYLREALPLYPLPPGMLVQVTQPLNASQVAGVLNGIAERHQRVWLLLWQEDLADPLRLTLTYLLGGARRHEVQAEFEHVALLLFSFPPGARFRPSPTGQRPLEVPFDEGLVLRGFDLTRDGFWYERQQTELQGGPPFTADWPSFRRGERLYVALYWRVEGPVARDYTAFVQVLGSDGRWVAGDDHTLGSDLFPATRWRVGETYVQYHTLPLPEDLPPGEYTVVAGLYWRGQDGALHRVLRTDGGGEHVVLGTVHVFP